MCFNSPEPTYSYLLTEADQVLHASHELSSEDHRNQRATLQS